MSRSETRSIGEGEVVLPTPRRRRRRGISLCAQKCCSQSSLGQWLLRTKRCVRKPNEKPPKRMSAGHSSSSRLSREATKTAKTATRSADVRSVASRQLLVKFNFCYQLSSSLLNVPLMAAWNVLRTTQPLATGLCSMTMNRHLRPKACVSSIVAYNEVQVGLLLLNCRCSIWQNALALA